MGSRRELCRISVSRQQSSTITFNLAHIWIGKFSVNQVSCLLLRSDYRPWIASKYVGLKTVGILDIWLVLVLKNACYLPCNNLSTRLLVGFKLTQPSINKNSAPFESNQVFQSLCCCASEDFWDKNCNVKEGGLDGSYVRILKLILILLI